jgi:hypothetical protein
MAIKRPQAIDDAPVRAAAQRRMAGQRLSCLREEWAKPRGRKSQRRHCGKAIEAQPSLWPDRVIDETAPSRARRPLGKVMRPWDPARLASHEKSQTRARKDTSIPEPGLAEKCSLQQTCRSGRDLSPPSVPRRRHKQIPWPLAGNGWVRGRSRARPDGTERNLMLTQINVSPNVNGVPSPLWQNPRTPAWSYG